MASSSPGQQPSGNQQPNDKLKESSPGDWGRRLNLWSHIQNSLYLYREMRQKSEARSRQKVEGNREKSKDLFKIISKLQKLNVKEESKNLIIDFINKDIAGVKGDLQTKVATSKRELQIQTSQAKKDLEIKQL